MDVCPFSKNDADVDIRPYAYTKSCISIDNLFDFRTIINYVIPIDFNRL